MKQSSLSQELERRIAEETGARVAVEEVGGSIRLRGVVEADAARDRAGAIVAAVAPEMRVENQLEVTWSATDDVASMGSNDANAADPVESLEALQEGGALEPDFTDAPLDTDEPDVVQEGANVYFPPTDPVIRIENDGHLEVLGGFSPTSLTSDRVAPSAEDTQLGDAAIEDAVCRELREDAATTDLVIDVSVENGVVHLRGTVPDLDDAENAEAVAARVPGVIEVSEELDVRSV
jgi:osmotically-inducible protein OsmY